MESGIFNISCYFLLQSYSCYHHHCWKKKNGVVRHHRYLHHLWHHHHSNHHHCSKNGAVQHRCIWYHRILVRHAPAFGFGIVPPGLRTTEQRPSASSSDKKRTSSRVSMPWVSTMAAAAAAEKPRRRNIARIATASAMVQSKGQGSWELVVRVKNKVSNKEWTTAQTKMKCALLWEKWSR